MSDAPWANDPVVAGNDSAAPWANDPIADKPSTAAFVGTQLVRGAGNAAAGLTNLGQGAYRYATGQEQASPEDKAGNVITDALPDAPQAPDSALGRIAGSAIEGAGSAAPFAAPMLAIPGLGWGTAALTELGGALGGGVEQAAHELGLGDKTSAVLGMGASMLTPTGLVSRGVNTAARLAGKAPIMMDQGAKDTLAAASRLDTDLTTKGMVNGKTSFLEGRAAGSEPMKAAISDAGNSLQNNGLYNVANAWNPGQVNRAQLNPNVGQYSDALFDTLTKPATMQSQVVGPLANSFINGMAPPARGQVLANVATRIGSAMDPVEASTALSRFEKNFPQQYEQIFRHPDPYLKPGNQLFQDYRTIADNMTKIQPLAKNGREGGLSDIAVGLLGEHALGPYGLAAAVARPVAKYAASRAATSPYFTNTAPFTYFPYARKGSATAVGLSSFADPDDR